MKTIIKAQPGWFLLTAIYGYHEGDTKEIERVNLTPVIAWHIDTHTPNAEEPLVVSHFTTPITAEMENFEPSPMLMTPSGEVFEAGNQSWGRFTPRHLAETDGGLIERFKEIETNRARGRGKEAQVDQNGPEITAEEAVGLMREALMRIEHPAGNAQGGEMQVSGAYWRVARVISEFLLPRMKKEHGAAHFEHMVATHGHFKKPV